MSLLRVLVGSMPLDDALEHFIGIKIGVVILLVFNGC